MSKISFFIVFTLSVLTFSPPVFASCATPSGRAGDLLFNSTSKVIQFCNGYSWAQIGDKPKGGGGCTSPSGTAGIILFNSNYRVMQHCNSQEWAAWGKLNGTGAYTGNCASPTGITGDLLFNSGFGVLQYCDGNTWQQASFVPPTLSMSFTEDKYSLNNTNYSGIDSFITASGGTFSRSTTGTYFNSAGTMQVAAINTPRLDYDPATKEAKGLLIEEYRTNTILQSAAINNAAWTKGDVTVTANTASAPDGTTSAELVTANQALYSYFGQATSWPANSTITRSIYAKAGTTNYILFEQKVSNTLNYTAFVLSGAGQVQTSPSGTTASIQYVGNDWYRLVATRTFTAASGAANAFSIIYLDAPGSSAAGHSAYFWGGQLEIGETASSYIPTTTSAVARDEDSFTVPTSSWFNPAAGTLVAGFNSRYLGLSNWPGPASLDDGTQSNAMHFFIGNPWAQAFYAEVYTGGNSVFQQSSAVTYTPGTNALIALSYSSAYSVSAMNGATNSVVTSIQVPTVSLLRIGASRGDLGPMAGWIQQIAYYPYPFSTANLQRMTQP